MKCNVTDPLLRNMSIKGKVWEWELASHRTATRIQPRVTIGDIPTKEHSFAIGPYDVTSLYALPEMEPCQRHCHYVLSEQIREATQSEDVAFALCFS